MKRVLNCRFKRKNQIDGAFYPEHLLPYVIFDTKPEDDPVYHCRILTEHGKEAGGWYIAHSDLLNRYNFFKKRIG